MSLNVLLCVTSLVWESSLSIRQCVSHAWWHADKYIFGYLHHISTSQVSCFPLLHIYLIFFSKCLIMHTVLNLEPFHTEHGCIPRRHFSNPHTCFIIQKVNSFSRYHDYSSLPKEFVADTSNCLINICISHVQKIAKR